LLFPPFTFLGSAAASLVTSKAPGPVKNGRERNDFIKFLRTNMFFMEMKVMQPIFSSKRFYKL